MNKSITIGMDLGDKFHITVVFDIEGNELETAIVTNSIHHVRFECFEEAERILFKYIEVYYNQSR